MTGGIQAAAVAYAIWGLLTIYWKQLADFAEVELIAWRIAAAGAVMVVVISARRRWPAMRATLGNPPLLARITAAALLLTGNWIAYVYAVTHDRVIETALGYFIAPLFTMAIGVVVFHERPSMAQRWAIALAGVAVVVLTISYGRLPLAALVIAASWSLYGLLKRQVPLSAVDSLAAETFVLFVPALIAIVATAGRSSSIPQSGDPGDLVLVGMAGFATVVPLSLFAYAAPRVPFTILGPLNYLLPTINFLLGWLLYDEDLPLTRLLGFAVVWVALAIVTTDRVRSSIAQRRDPARLQAATPD